MRLGEILRVYREHNDGNKGRHDPLRHGLREMAAEIGVSPTTLSRIEKGHAPDQKTLQALWGWLTFPES
jgi:transcriptional regulator with XRE-family HTH domain